MMTSFGAALAFKRIALMCGLAGCLVLIGCERQIRDSNLSSVKSDMSTKEVESVLGPPTRVESPNELKTQELKTMKVTRYIYDQKGKEVELLFVNDHLATNGVNGKFGE